MVARWRRRNGLRAPPGKRAQFTRRIGGFADTATSAADWYAVNLDALVSYLAKSAEPLPAAAALVHRALEPGGSIVGKRCGTTNNIGRAAWALGNDGSAQAVCLQHLA
ncbi:hypothetical protein EAH84_15385 [Sphingomonas oligophenolica]|uniref:Uncharacterized protein n=2 Tax=Sphingomonas oligophenolica TaxID=301154 RepID=A0A502BXY0_9SPHN|nr:hypothetical protein EAH84_15385 [Sphingomonas oligophenolica]